VAKTTRARSEHFFGSLETSNDVDIFERRQVIVDLPINVPTRRLAAEISEPAVEIVAGANAAFAEYRSSADFN
jgi:hypothetical protein